MITNVVDDDSLSWKVKEIIKYIDKHDGIIDKVFLDIFTDMSNIYGESVTKNEMNDTITVKINNTKNYDSMYTEIMNCVSHHITMNIPIKYQSDIQPFLYKIVSLDGTTILIVRKK